MIQEVSATCGASNEGLAVKTVNTSRPYYCHIRDCRGPLLHTFSASRYAGFDLGFVEKKASTRKKKIVGPARARRPGPLPAKKLGDRRDKATRVIVSE